jgi:hypothetical protein
MSDAANHVDRLRSARTELADARDAVAEHGEDRLETVRDAHREATSLLDRYEGKATGTGDFRAFVQFQESFVELVEGLPADLPAREAFEEANDLLDQRRLDEDDFARARDLLGPAADRAALLEERAAAEERYETARRDARKRLRDLDDRIDRLERLQRPDRVLRRVGACGVDGLPARGERPRSPPRRRGERGVPARGPPATARRPPGVRGDVSGGRGVDSDSA